MFSVLRKTFYVILCHKVDLETLYFYQIAVLVFCDVRAIVQLDTIIKMAAPWTLTSDKITTLGQKCAFTGINVYPWFCGSDIVNLISEQDTQPG